MSDLIDRAEAVERLLALTVYKSKRELIEAVEESVANENGWVGGIAECIDEIEDMPAAPRWVRCKECKHHEDEELGMVYCPKIVGSWVGENWYCADGEREVQE